MTDPIRIDIDSRQVTDALAELVRRVENPRAAFALIGEALVESSKQRFATETAPDGSRWAPNTQATIEAYVDRITGVFNDKRKRVGDKKGALLKGGRISSRTAARVANKKVLQVSGLLRDQIDYNPLPDGVEIGTNRKYGAMMQLGGKKSEYPHLWGDIPARPFLGLSDADEREVLDIVQDFLAGALR